MQSVMLMACKFQQDNEANLDTSVAPGGRGKHQGYCHVPIVVPVLRGAEEVLPCRATGAPRAWIHVSPMHWHLASQRKVTSLLT